MAELPTMNPFAAPRAELEGGVAVAELQLADRGTRLVAVLLDSLVFLPIGILAVVLAVVAKENQTLFGVGMALVVLASLALVIYQLVLLSTQGQTLGKRWMKVRIVSMDGSKAGFVKAVLLRAFVNGLIGAVPYLGMVYSLVDILMIFREDRRCIHDLIAGTRVVVAN
jgi:uncharacterized RDD family membrane protein YckC